MAATKTPAKKAPAKNIWSDEERSAMRASAQERKASAKVTPDQERAAGEAEIQAKIADMPEPDKSMATRIHELVLKAAPDLMPRTYYGMPAYAKDGKTVCFFKPASKFKERYATLGFEQKAHLDDGTMWPYVYALTDLSKANAERITQLVKQAVG